MHIEHALLQVLKERRYPVARFARDIGIARSHVYRILRGNHSPTLDTVRRMSEALQMSVSEFIGLLEDFQGTN
ncbi:MAG: helix-turn-helix transcriptional regulator [Sphaerochaetaceae bacterium]|jgi:DNA-binding phage protein|nr:helix-turn-helix transcriptional regulator [Sphaerochaetaceae bacterium]MDX9939190.1 helix-turn-helix transcriptional regulator [Sphaerochaetaceae bacterium]